MALNLARCPFCAGKPYIHGNFEHGYQLLHNCEGDSLFRISASRNTEEEVIAAWNSRATSPASAPQVEAGMVRAAADICQKWLDNFSDSEIEYTSPREYAVGAVLDIKEAIEALTREQEGGK